MSARQSFVALLVATALAAGCSDSDESSGHAAATDAPPAAGPSTTLPVFSEPAPTFDQLVGVWRNGEGTIPSQPPLRVRLSADGTMAFDNHGQLDTAPAVVGTYKLDGRTINFTSGPSDACSSGDTWSWTVGLIDETHLHSVISEDGTGNCRVGLGIEWTWTRTEG